MLSDIIPSVIKNKSNLLNINSKVRSNLIVKIIAFFLLFFLTSTIYSQHEYTWNLESSPIYSNLNNLQIINDTSAIALGNQVIILKNNSWKLMSSQPGAHPSLIYSFSFNSVWISTLSDYQESKLFFYNGINWKEVFNPLANTISSIKFENKNFGVISGLGEIALYKFGKWEYLSPPSNDILSQVNFGSNSDLIVASYPTGIFKSDFKNWKLLKGSENARLLTIFNKKIFFIKDSLLCTIESDTTLVLSKNNLLHTVNSFDISPNGTLTAVGNGGVILNYRNNSWTKLSSPVNYNLNSVKMISDTLGWIVGNNGTILKFSKNKPKTIFSGWKGFNKINLYLKSKKVDDEYGVAMADFNKDDFVDIFTCGLFESNHLYINNRNYKFIDESEERGVGGSIESEGSKYYLGVCAGDLDNDGNDDLYVTVLNGKNKIYKNLGNGYFIDYSSISKATGSKDDRTNSVLFGDVDNDGDLDIFIANEYSSNRLYVNNGAGIFREITDEAGLKSAYGGTGCSFGDIDNDGDIDLYVANWSTKNLLYKNLLVEKGKLFFENITDIAKVGGEVYSKSNAVVFCDIDNDADLDLYVTNRKTSNCLYINNGTGQFTDKTIELIGKDSLKSYGAVIADFDGDGFKDIYLSNVGENILYKNNNNKFQDKTIEYDAGINGYSTGSAAGDLDNDGDLDLYLSNYLGESSAMLKNKLDNTKYIKLKIIGYSNNRNAIGTKIYIYQESNVNEEPVLIDFEEVTGGSGYGSMNETSKTIQIQNNKYVTAKIIFPSGLIKTINHIKAGSNLTISDVEGFGQTLSIVKRQFIRLIFDPHNLFELLKWIFIILFIGYSSIRGYKRYDWDIAFVIISFLFLLIAYYIQYSFLEYENILFSTILPLTSIIVTITLVHLYYEREQVKRLSEVEEREIREKLSRDLHDDLASTISSVGIYLTLINDAVKNDDRIIQKLFGKAESLIAEASSSITDLIWAIKPHRESLSNLVVRINEIFSEMFREKQIKFKSSANVFNDEIILEPRIKQNVFLITKEALNNILKYADAKKVEMNIKKEGSFVLISITDDGLGFDLNEAKNKGHGLTNMRKRAEEIDAEFKIETASGKGTTINLALKMT